MAAVPVTPGSDLAGYSGKWGPASYFPTLLPMKMQERELNQHFFYCQWFQSLWEWRPWNLPNQQFNKWRLCAAMKSVCCYISQLHAEWVGVCNRTADICYDLRWHPKSVTDSAWWLCPALSRSHLLRALPASTLAYGNSGSTSATCSTNRFYPTSLLYCTYSPLTYEKQISSVCWKETSWIRCSLKLKRTIQMLQP